MFLVAWDIDEVDWEQQKFPQNNKSTRVLNVLWMCELGLWLLYLDTKREEMGGFENTHVTSVIIHILFTLSIFNHPYKTIL